MYRYILHTVSRIRVTIILDNMIYIKYTRTLVHIQ